MNEEKKVNSDKGSEAPTKQAPKKAFEILKKCRCNSEEFHSLGEYYIIDQPQDDDPSTDLIIKKLGSKPSGSKPTEKPEDDE
jgi:hypothetical protein